MNGTDVWAALQARWPLAPQAAVLPGQDAQGQPVPFTGDDLQRASARLGRLILGLDLSPERPVALALPPSPEALLLALGVLRLGRTVLALSPDRPEAGLRADLARWRPGVLVCPAARFTPWSRLAFPAGTPHVFTLDGDRSGTLLARAAWQSEDLPGQPCPADRPAWVECRDAGEPTPCAATDLPGLAASLRRYADWPPAD